MMHIEESYFSHFNAPAIFQKPDFTSVISQVHPTPTPMKLGATLRLFSSCPILPLGMHE